ncbi:VOC family protein [Hymenobacter jeollabukensis]|uniref:VOC domain-containing protein n=1 Tax=Hymenobacter jeollabukensis TaxID=2025313 RepID=A0A5R8WP94_9BACT|nr:hypothetical protein [Hymenobacter jeollabukensis]TLM91878.1 hypothetical protein FDY95_15100 [Hymenobacter jeollabukensis]
MRILALHLLAPDMPALHHFYAAVLALPAQLTAAARRIQVGYSELIFRAAAPGTAPYYHFAFHVPHNQLDAAYAWLKARTALLPFTDGQPIADFPNWHARAFYFHDPAGNILECIARQDLPNAAAEPFSAASLLGLSEAGVVTPAVLPTAEALLAAHGIPPFHRGPRLPNFAALGDDEGLLILTETGRGWLPTARPAERHWLRIEGEQAGQPVVLEDGSGPLAR